MTAGVCTICGERFLNSDQLGWLREKVPDPMKLAHMVAYCPNCKQSGHGLVDR
jgi:hypothetical protein